MAAVMTSLSRSRGTTGPYEVEQTNIETRSTTLGGPQERFEADTAISLVQVLWPVEWSRREHDPLEKFHEGNSPPSGWPAPAVRKLNDTDYTGTQGTADRIQDIGEINVVRALLHAAPGGPNVIEFPEAAFEGLRCSSRQGGWPHGARPGDPGGDPGGDQPLLEAQRPGGGHRADRPPAHAPARVRRVDHSRVELVPIETSNARA